MSKIVCNHVSSRTSGKIVSGKDYPLIATDVVEDENGNTKSVPIDVVPDCDSREFSIAQNVRYGRGNVFNCRITSDPVDVINRISKQANIK